jgi:hypothetical protein
MATIGKILGQLAPSANTNTDLYTVPADTYVVSSSLVIANNAPTEGTVIVWARVAGAAVEQKQIVVPTVPTAGNDGKTLTLGITLGAGDILTVNASTADFSINLFGLEIS